MLNTHEGEQAMSVIKVLKNGRITLPKDFRVFWDIDDGQVLEAEATGTGLLLKPKTLVDKTSILSLKGKKPAKTPSTSRKKKTAKA